MWKIALFLIFTLIAVPIITFYYDEPLTAIQIESLTTQLIVYAIAAAICFVLSSLTDNYSQVDKLWSIMPVPYVWIAAHFDNYSPRLVLMAVLVTIWAIRLTYNFGRRGGYSIKFWTGEEDYRWSILRAKPGFEQKWKWVIFNLLFISAYQMALILLMTLPTVKATGSTVELNLVDYGLAAIILGLICIEFIADHQQYQYQQKKHLLKASNQEIPEYYKVGFTHTGLWSRMRHPNYMAEQSIWIVFYFFSVIATGHWINWSLAGALLLMLLFKGSSDFSESISLNKYPLYAKYQKEVGRFLPIKKKFKPD
jgi:steroid 5-alpha reductase family enzyme